MTTETETTESTIIAARDADGNKAPTNNVETTAGAKKLTYEQLEEYHDRAIADLVKGRKEKAEYKALVKELEEEARKVPALQEQVSKVEAKAREKVTTAEFWGLLRSDGINDRDILKLIPTAEVTYDENGEAMNIEDIYAAFKESKSSLLFNKTTATSNTSTTKVPTGGTKAAEVDMMELSDEEFKAERDAIRRLRNK